MTIRKKRRVLAERHRLMRLTEGERPEPPPIPPAETFRFRSADGAAFITKDGRAFAVRR